jgi:hypothetical protein
VIGSIAFSTVIGVALSLGTDASIVTSFLAGVLVEIALLLAGFHIRLEKVEKTILNGLGIQEMVMSDKELKENVTSIIKDYIAIKKKPTPRRSPIYYYALQKIAFVADILRKGANAELTDLPWEDWHFWAKECYLDSDNRTEFKSVHFETAEKEQNTGRFFGTKAGDEYWSYNLDALRNGAKIERIFIYRDHAELERYQNEINHQVEAKVIIRVVEASQLKADDLQNFFLKERAGKAQLVNWIGPGYGEFYQTVNVSTRAATLKSWQAIYDRIRAPSKEVVK